jgi:hypothetical protein
VVVEALLLFLLIGDNKIISVLENTIAEPE